MKPFLILAILAVAFFFHPPAGGELLADESHRSVQVQMPPVIVTQSVYDVGEPDIQVREDQPLGGQPIPIRETRACENNRCGLARRTERLSDREHSDHKYADPFRVRIPGEPTHQLGWAMVRKPAVLLNRYGFESYPRYKLRLGRVVQPLD